MTKPNDDKLNQSRQPETITFRMEHRIVEELPEEAEQKTERLNVLVNQILKIILNGISHIAGNIDFSKGYSRVKFFLMDKLLKKKN